MNTSKNQLISVIIPFYNTAFEYFEDAIYSLLSQSYSNWEAVIVNDGSNAEYKTFLESFIKSLNDSRLKVFHLKENGGPSMARNKGIEEANGEIICCLDSDDMFLPWYFKEIIEKFKNNSDCLIVMISKLHFFKDKKMYENKFFRALIENPEKILISKFIKSILNEEEKLFYNPIKYSAKKVGLLTTPMLCIKKEIFKGIKYDLSLYTGQDTDLCLQILKNIDLVDKTEFNFSALYLYRMYPNELRRTLRADLLFESRAKIINKYSDENFPIYKAVKLWLGNDGWKFSEYIGRYFAERSILNYLKNINSGFSSIKDKIKGIRALIKMIFKYDFLCKILKIDYRKFELSSKKNINRTMEIKEKLIDYLNNCTEDSIKLYANKVFSKVI